MKIDEFGIKDLFRAATGNIAGEADLGKQLIKIYPKASTGEILKMISKYKELQKRGYKDSDIDLLSLGDPDKIDPQILKKQDLQRKYSQQDIEKMRQKQDILKRQRKNQKKQPVPEPTPEPAPEPTPQDKKSSRTDYFSPLTTVEPGATMTIGGKNKLTFDGNVWVDQAGQKYGQNPDSLKQLNDAYLRVENAKRAAEKQKIRLKAYQKVFGN